MHLGGLSTVLGLAAARLLGFLASSNSNIFNRFFTQRLVS